MKSLIPIVTFILVSVIIAITAHKYLSEKKPEHFLTACLISGIISSIIFQILGLLVLGYLDPFFFIAFVVGALISTGIALLVGIIQKHLKTDNEIA